MNWLSRTRRVRTLCGIVCHRKHIFWYIHGCTGTRSVRVSNQEPVSSVEYPARGTREDLRACTRRARGCGQDGQFHVDKPANQRARRVGNAKNSQKKSWLDLEQANDSLTNISAPAPCNATGRTAEIRPHHWPTYRCKWLVSPPIECSPAGRMPGSQRHWCT
jgi:hypothetical protein